MIYQEQQHISLAPFHPNMEGGTLVDMSSGEEIRAAIDLDSGKSVTVPPDDQLLSGDNVDDVFDVDISESEKQLLRGLLNDNTARIDVIIPSDIKPNTLWESMETCFNVYGRIDKAKNKLKPIISRMLVVLKKYPEVYQARGYKNWSDFLGRGMYDLMGISKTDAFHYLRIGVTMPQLTPAEFERIGVTKLQYISRPDAEHIREELISKAQEPGFTVQNVKEMILNQSTTDPDEMNYSHLNLKLSQATRKRFLAFIANPNIQSYCGGDAPGLILERMLDECEGTWYALGQAGQGAG